MKTTKNVCLPEVFEGHIRIRYEEDQLAIYISNKSLGLNLGYGFPFTIFCPYFLHRKPSPKISESVELCTTTRGSCTPSPDMPPSVDCISVFL
jgi:hypothetical protein